MLRRAFNPLSILSKRNFFSTSNLHQASQSTPTSSKPTLSTPSALKLDENEVAMDYNDRELPGFREAGTIPTNYEIATGKERYEFMKALKGEEAWEDMTPIKMFAKGTKEAPIQVSGVDPVFYVGCTGFPADTHDVVFLTLHGKRPFDRCPNCGNVYKYNQVQVEEEEH